MNAHFERALTIEPTPYEPPSVRPDLVAVMNAAATRRAVLVTISDRTVALRIRPPPASMADAALDTEKARPAPSGPGARLEWTLDGERQSAIIPATLFEALILQRPRTTDPEAAAMLLEGALSQPLGALEAKLQGLVQLNNLTSVATCDDPLANLCLELEHENTIFPIALTLGPVAMAALPGLLLQLPRRIADIAALPVQICFRVGLTELDLEALRNLQPGDAVLMQETGLLEGRLAAIVGEQRMAPARLAAAGIELESGLRSARGTPVGRWCVDNNFDEPVDEEVGAMRVTLVFELGRRLASLAEIEAMGPGTVVETGGWPDGMVDVLANGRRIGRGRIVQVGGALAVQLERINHGAAK